MITQPKPSESISSSSQSSHNNTHIRPPNERTNHSQLHFKLPLPKINDQTERQTLESDQNNKSSYRQKYQKLQAIFQVQNQSSKEEDTDEQGLSADRSIGEMHIDKQKAKIQGGLRSSSSSNKKEYDTKEDNLRTSKDKQSEGSFSARLNDEGGNHPQHQHSPNRLSSFYKIPTMDKFKHQKTFSNTHENTNNNNSIPSIKSSNNSFTNSRRNNNNNKSNNSSLLNKSTTTIPNNMHIDIQRQGTCLPSKKHPNGPCDSSRESTNKHLSKSLNQHNTAINFRQSSPFKKVFSFIQQKTQEYPQNNHHQKSTSQLQESSRTTAATTAQKSSKPRPKSKNHTNLEIIPSFNKQQPSGYAPTQQPKFNLNLSALQLPKDSNHRGRSYSYQNKRSFDDHSPLHIKIPSSTAHKNDMLNFHDNNNSFSDANLSALNYSNNNSTMITAENTKKTYNQYDLDNSFITIFNQSQIGLNATQKSQNYQNRLMQKKLRNIHQMNRNSASPRSNRSLFELVGKSGAANSSRKNKGPQSILHSLRFRKNQREKYNSVIVLTQQCDMLISDNAAMRKHEECKKLIMAAIKDVEEDHFRQILPNLLELLSTSVDINDLSLFKIIVEYLGDLAYEMNDMPAAVFFYNESKTIYSCTSEHSKKARMLLCLGRCARKCMVLNQGSKLLRKGLEYAWLVNDQDIELEIYDEMGRNYYLEGNIDQAYYYHTRFTDGLFEQMKSPNRIFSSENVKNYLQKSPFTFHEVSSLLLSYLKLPLLTLEQLPQATKTARTNYVNGITPRAVAATAFCQEGFEDSNAKELLEKIVAEDEFYILVQPPQCMRYRLDY